MNKSLKYLLAPVLLLIPPLLYYGSYLPLKKSQSLIDALQTAPSSDSLASYKNYWLSVLDFNSPVGEEETLKQFASVTFDMVAKKRVPPEVVKELMGFVSSYVEPAIERGSGSGFVQYHYILGTLYERVGLQYKLPEYLDKAEKLYKAGLLLSPTRPQFFYGLLDIYSQTGRQEQAQEIARKILEYWPRGLN